MARSRGFLIMALLVTGCAAPKPILYPNAHLQQVGKEVADRDVDECREMAKGPARPRVKARAGRSPAVPQAGRHWSSRGGAVAGRG